MHKRIQNLAVLVLLMLIGIVLSCPRAFGDKQIKIIIPKRSRLTPVQKLNREGVDEIEKHQYSKAEASFMKAYLYDSSDPFTLYNLAYTAELQGELDRAEKFYELALQQATDATIDRSNVRSLKGEPMRKAVLSVDGQDLRVSQSNIDAIRLLKESRAREAEFILTQTLKLDPQSALTINNLGVAQEAQGNFVEADDSYRRAAAMCSSLTTDRVSPGNAFGGKPVSEIAASNARALEQRMQSAKTHEAQASLLNSQGVAAVNRNDWTTASQDFQKAYSLDPNSAFSLNNSGFLAEINGDPETAQFFYDRAKLAPDSAVPIGLATRQNAEGEIVATSAGGSSQQVDMKLSALKTNRQKENAPVVLRHRDNSPVVEPTTSTPKTQQ